MILLLKVTLLFAAGWCAALLLARRSAAARHFVWALTLTGALALTITAPLAPIVPVRVAAWPAAPAVPAPAIIADGLVPSGTPDFPASAAAPASHGAPAPTGWRQAFPAGWSTGVLLGALWLLGAVVVAAWYGLGHLRLFQLARRALPVSNAEWHASLRDVAVRAGVAVPVRLLRTASVGSPLTWGTLRPVVLLPDDAESWTAERQRVVLGHELAHAVRGDYLSQLIACVACALYWFHPLVWVAARRLRVESERACDDHVLIRGVSGVDYAAHLLDVARRSRSIRLGGGVAIGMARSSHLEGRLLAVLDPARPRQVPPRRARRAGWAGLAMLVLPLAVITPVAGGSALVNTVAPRPEPVRARVPEAATRPVRQGVDSVFERSAAASPGEQLELDLESGASVDIRGWDRPAVRLRARLGGDNWADTRVTLERTDGGVRLHSWQEVRRRTSSTSHAFELMVPRRYDVHISSAGGQVTLADLEGVFDGDTGGGGILIERARGEAHLNTGGGDIKVSDSELRGRVNTGGGLVMLSRVRGGLKGSSGSGPVIHADGEGGSGDLSGVRVDRSGTAVSEPRGIDSRGVAAAVGMLHIEKAGGPITLEAAPEGAEVHTGGGDVRIGRSVGFVSASSGGGNITIGPVAGSVKAGTGAGTVQVWISEAGASERLIEVSSGSGSVVIELPPNLSARFELETAYTSSHGRKVRIESDWELSQEETDRWDDSEGSPRKYVRATGSVGTRGPLIKVKTVNGDITVRRRSP